MKRLKQTSSLHHVVSTDRFYITTTTLPPRTSTISCGPRRRWPSSCPLPTCSAATMTATSPRRTAPRSVPRALSRRRDPPPSPSSPASSTPSRSPRTPTSSLSRTSSSTLSSTGVPVHRLHSAHRHVRPQALLHGHLLSCSTRSSRWGTDTRVPMHLTLTWHFDAQRPTPRTSARRGDAGHESARGSGWA